MKLFLDCGCYVGKSWKLFKKTVDYTSDFICIAFDPCLKTESQIEDIIFVDKALYTYDGEIEFFKSKKKKGKANSIYHNPNAKCERKYVVQCIDFSKYIMDNFSKDDFIVCKMDIEGAENDVLEKMISDGSIEYINILYLEPHNKDYKYKANAEAMAKLDIQRRTAIEWCYKKYLK